MLTTQDINQKCEVLTQFTNAWKTLEKVVVFNNEGLKWFL